MDDREKHGIRLNKYISEAGVCSRREADCLILEGKITVDGAIGIQGQKILEHQEVFLEGKKIIMEEEGIILACNKPAGIVCTTATEENGKKVANIIDLIQYPKRVYPVGRLDKDSQGLILLTNQGELMERILRSRYDHEKEYFVEVNKKITNVFTEGMRSGVPILNTMTKPCMIKKVDDYHFRIILTQGLNRQIRRMCEYFNYKVRYLRRDRIMNICLDGLKEGMYRKLTAEEVKELKKQAHWE